MGHDDHIDNDNNVNDDDDDDQEEVDGTSPTTRRHPFLLITGTPGVGKTAMASLLADRLGYIHCCVSEIVKEHEFYDGRDETLDSYYLDEDKLLDYMEELFQECDRKGTCGIVCDYHACELFPERWFDLVLVLQTSTQVLFDRLVQREYSETKRSMNMECEIMQVVLEEARNAYPSELVHPVPSNTMEDMEANCDRVVTWIEQWKQTNSKTTTTTTATAAASS